MRRIFIADDDPDDLQFFREAVNIIDNKAEIISAENGSDLFELFRKNFPPPPTYVFLDLNMPKKSGHDCLEEIRSHPDYKDFKIIILTTSRSQNDIDQTYRQGADYYIHKPMSLEGLRKAISRIFSADFNSRIPKEKFVIEAN